MSEFEGKVAIVTGASSGIGKRTAEMLVQRGALVVVLSRSRSRIESLADSHQGRMIAVAGDVSELSSIERLFGTAESKFGPCDIVVNNAGMIDPGLLIDVTIEQWDRMFAVNVRGIFLTCRRALPKMLERGSGAIVNVASISGMSGPGKFPGYVSYSASKAAVIALTESVAVEVKDRGVRVNCVSPGSVDTPMWTEAGGGAPASMSAEEVAEAILFLASERSRPVNGQNLAIFSA